MWRSTVTHQTFITRARPDHHHNTHNVGREGQEGSVFARSQPAVKETRRVGRPHSLTPAWQLSASITSILGLERLLGIPAAVARFQQVTVRNLLESKYLSF